MRYSKCFNESIRGKLRRVTAVIAGFSLLFSSAGITSLAEQEQRKLICGKEEHRHTETCYEQVLACGLEEHTHTDECYEVNPPDPEPEAEPESLTDPKPEPETEPEQVSESEPAAENNDENQTGEQEQKDPEEGTSPAAQTFFEGTLEFEAIDFKVTANIRADAELPADVELHVREIVPGTEEYNLYSGRSADILTDDWRTVTDARFLDITFLSDGVEIEPKADVDIQIVFNDILNVDENTDVQTLHFADGDEPTVVAAETGSVEAAARDGRAVASVSFSSDSFSVYGVVQTRQILEKIIVRSGKTYKITVKYSSDTEIPNDVTLEVTEILPGTEAYEIYANQTAAALNVTEVNLSGLYDISILNAAGEKIQPKEAVSVEILLLNEDAINPEETMQVVHFPEDIENADISIPEETGTPVVPSLEVEAEVITPDVEGQTVSFEATGFSVYALAYTVDFHYEVNGKMYEFTLPGGGFVSLYKLAEVLGLNNATDGSDSEEVNTESTDGEQPELTLTLNDVEVSDTTRQFVADVENVEFSNPELVDVSKVESETTVEEIKESRGLTVQYSAELTEEQIAQINGTIVEPGDWALISIQPFKSEETLNVTMKNGDAFTIRVTDAQIKKTVMDARGDTWEITVNYNEEAEIPEDAELRVREILPEDEEYEAYYQQSLEMVGAGIAPDTAEDGQDSEANNEEPAAETASEENSVSTYAHIFDIQIWADDHEIQPASEVSVSIKLLDAPEEDTDLRVVHFGKDGLEEMELAGDGGETGEKAGGTELNFVTDEFSVYAIVTGPSGAQAGWLKLTSLDTLTSSEGYYIGHTSGYYLKNTTTSKDSNGTTLSGIERTGQKTVPTISGAERYYFENASDGRFYIYCMDGETKKYVVNNGDASLSFTADENNRTAFTVAVNSSGVFKIHNGDWYWNMQTGTGAGFYSKNKANDGNNNLYLWEPTDPGTDTYELNGKTFGLMTWTGGKTAKALMAAENHEKDENDVPYSGCLEAKFLTVMTKASNTGNKLYVPNNTTDTVTGWTFEWVGNDPSNRLNSYYYLKADNGKYLKITADGLSLVDEPCRIQAIPGTGDKEGQICLKSVGNGSKALTYSGTYAKGYNVGGPAGSEWLYLVEPRAEQQLADYQKVYTATKVSVSDTEKVNTGAKIIIYARQWKNDHYEYYAINSQGELVPCYESGDRIEWYGGNVNDMLWQFTEYCYEDSDVPNGYYELENLYARSIGAPSYLAPKYSDGSVLSSDTVGVLLQGRTDQQYYSPIVAWDTPEYMYSALTVDLNQTDPVLESCVRADGLDFYFAIMEDLPVDDVLHTVPTVDNNQYGIVMKMVDLANGKNTEDLTGQMNNFLQNGIKNGKTWEHTPGLLSTNLTNGYPTTTKPGSGGSLAGLYSGESVVNHLFIASTYRATGYFEYNSAQNFASLQGSDFVVYQELGSNDTTKKDTLQHGQFFPYNDIEAGRFTSVNRENLYTVTADLLSESDPRKHEQLYLVKGTTDYYFAMELEASFIQTPNGLDAWGHDIIFEFSGDDDFWLYVDDELVIDLGGIHSAVTGTVNFRTGTVVLNPKSTQHGRTTTLLDLFAENYKARDSSLTLEEAKEIAKTKFKQNDAEQWVFKDNTKHTMRIFYMERGAGASNLHMKFNLASVKKGTVELHKELEGVDETEKANALFPYQVYYRMEDEDSSTQERMLRNAFAPGEASDDYKNVFGAPESTDYVFYKDSTKPVTFLPELEVGGVTYYNVFMLKPDETAVLNFPVIRRDPDHKEITVGEYRIVECGIDPSVFTEVTVNDKVNNGELNPGNNLKDYGIEMATTDDRPTVNYVNKAETLRNLTFTKELYRKYDADPVKVNPDGSQIDGTGPRAEQDKDEETFEFRLYFKTIYDSDFAPANLHVYHVKDPAGYYCTWNSADGRFERITNDKYPGYLKPGYENGTTDYANLTDDNVSADGSVTHLGKYRASFETSPNGSIESIPAYYTVEVRDLIPGTEYKLIERPTEMPDGYKFWQYTNDADPDGTAHTDPYDPWDGIAGRIGTNADATVLVRNYKGYGFRLTKVWEDAQSMQGRDPTYFALYTVNSDGAPVTLVNGSVKQLAYHSDPKKQQLYWWYLSLPIAETGLNDYAVFEVQLTGDSITAGNDGVVSGYKSIAAVSEGGIVKLNGTLTGESQPKEIKYTVNYAEPVDISDNVRAFKATNAPAELPYVQFVKTDWIGTKLPGADFSMRYGEDLSESLFNPATKTSDGNGLISQEYLQENVAYTLTELKSPQGYVGIDGPLTVTLKATASGWELDVSPEIPAGYPTYYEVTTEDNILTLIVKNRPYDFRAVKMNSTNTEVLAGAKFNLYKQVTVGGTSTWDDAHPVYTDLTTDTYGVIPKINNTLPAGTYQLRETQAPDGYLRMNVNIDFTVSELGEITLGNKPDGVTLTRELKNDDVMEYEYIMTIPNIQEGRLIVSKTVLYDNSKPSFTFTVTILDDSGKTNTSFSGTYGEMSFNSGVATFKLTNDQSMTATGLPPETKYTVTEKEETDYLTSRTVTSTIAGETEHGTISPGETETVAFTNSKVTRGAVTIRKTWTVEDPEATAVLLKLWRVANNAATSVTPESADVIRGTVVTIGGQSYIRIAKSGNTWPELTINNLPDKIRNNDGEDEIFDCTYFVEEVGYQKQAETEILPIPDTWTVTYGGGSPINISALSGTRQLIEPKPVTDIQTEDILTVNNTVKVGSVEVTKAFVFPAGSNLNVDQDFRITASWGAAPHTQSVVLKISESGYAGSLPTGVTVTKSGTGTETDPYKWLINGLPLNTTATFGESGCGIDGYIVTSTVSVNGEAASAGISGTARPSNTDPLPDSAKVAFVNEYKAGVELPATGGPGTLLYTIAGLMLITLAAVLLIVRKRKYNR